jgi:hypothetical protein
VATNQKSSLTRERFQSTLTFDQYVQGMKSNQERMLQHLEETEIPQAELDWWRSRGPINVFVLTYDNCGDALYNLPVLGKIARQAPNVDLRVAQRDDNLDIMDQHLNQGTYRSVPTFIFLDQDFNEIGNLKERAESMTRIVESEGIALRRRLREENKEPWRQEMIREFHDVVENQKKYP